MVSLYLLLEETFVQVQVLQQRVTGTKFLPIWLEVWKRAWSVYGIEGETVVSGTSLMRVG